MTPGRFQQVSELFFAVVEMDSAKRENYLANACQGDDSLLQEVTSLLEADSASSGLFSTDGLEQGTLASGTPGSAIVKVPPGSRFGYYHIDAFLGAGGMGQVYLATDSRLGRKVALKLLPPRKGDEGARVQRFENEARAASALNHPNIVTVYDIGLAEEGRFLVMEHVAGNMLREMLAAGPMLDQLPPLGTQMARALAAAHEGGIAHRDIKPENIMVRPDGLVKVLDFGLASLTLSGDAGAASGARLLGTVRYMSPEQARGGTTGFPSDIFSLGIVFYEMATGSHPFASDSMLSALHALIGCNPAKPSNLNSAVDAALDQLILAMLDRDPAMRPSANDVAKALELRSLAARPANGLVKLPAERTPFIGRQEELAALTPFLHDRRFAAADPHRTRRHRKDKAGAPRGA